MEGLLKGSCDACTASKVKCSGGNPCERCKSREMACSYRPKRKRGPQKSGKDGQAKRNLRDEDFAFVSSYEKRIWSTFFTMFKNQNRSRSDSPYAWCWFASQLEKLKRHLASCNNENALNRLEAWLDALDVDLAKIVGGVKKKCVFAAHQCGSCSAIAMSAPNAMGIPISTNVTVGESLPFDVRLNDRPRLLMDTTSCGTRVTVNEAFAAEFGISEDDLAQLVDWSGGGFLPWGGDVLAKLIVRESDLLVFLQIMAIKFQALGPPEHGVEHTIQREVPSTHMFELWAANECTAKYLLHCLHLEQIEGNEMATQFRVSLERVGSVSKPNSGDKQVSLAELNRDTKRAKHSTEGLPASDARASDAEPSLGDSFARPHPQEAPDPGYGVLKPENSDDPVGPAQDPQFTAIDVVPPVHQEYYNGWSHFDNTGVGNESSPPSLLVPQPEFDSIDLEGLDSENPEFEDSMWLNSLLEWSGHNAASSHS